MISTKQFVQAAFITTMLCGGAMVAVAAQAAETAKPATTQVDTSGPSQLIESSANVLLKGIDSRRAEFRKDLPCFTTGRRNLAAQFPRQRRAASARRALAPMPLPPSGNARPCVLHRAYSMRCMVDFTSDRLR